MVEARQASASGAIANWQEHIDGKTNFSPVILPLAPAKFTGAVYLVTGKSAAPECVDFNNSLQKLWDICADSSTSWRWYNAWNAGLYVLGF
jgi:hypothetical protein